jgi:protein SCO1/2
MNVPTRARPAAATGTAPRIGATVVLCLLFVAAFACMTWRLTQGLEAWTYEDLRRLDAASGRLRTPAMALRDAQGQTLHVFSAEADPKVYVVDFIYTRCPTICQVLGNEYFRMQEALRETGGGAIHLLSVSIDPLRDLQPQLAAHGKLHKADPAFWTIASPREAQAGSNALRRLGVVAVPDGLGGFVHNGAIHLIDARGRVHGIYDYEQWPQALAGARRLASAAGQ